MKFFLLLLPICLFSNEVEWVDKKIDAIKPPRLGISVSNVNKVEDPFIDYKGKKALKKSSKRTYKKKSRKAYSSKPVYKKIPKFSVDAIINKAAFINRKWHKVGAKIDSFTITDIERTRVELSYKNQTYFLSTEKKNKKLKFNNN